MFTTLKTLMVALVAAVMMTGSASALTSVSAGNSYDYDIKSDTLFIGTANSYGGAGSHFVNFFSSVDPTRGQVNASVTIRILGTFTGLTMNWVDAATNTVLNSTAVLAGITTLNTLFSAPNISQKLVFNWQNSTPTRFGQPVSFDFDVSAVPLPAAGLLLLTALGGLGLARRRKTAGAA